MRLSGSPDGCDAAARQLQRAAVEVSRAAEDLHRAQVADWVGAAAQGWDRLASEQVRRLRASALVLGAVGRAVAQHAHVLRELQARAGRLTAQADEARLHLDASGWIAPVPLPEPGDPQAVREALHRREVRRRVLAGAEQVRAEEERAHVLLLGELARAVELPLPGSDGAWGLDDRARNSWQGSSDVVSWRPNQWDLPPALISLAQAAASVTDRLPPVLRDASVTSFLGLAVSIPVDVLVNDHDLDDAITKNLVVTGTAAGVGAAAAGSAPGWVAVGLAGAAGWGTGRLFDAFGHHLPWVQHSSERRSDRRRRPAYGAPSPRHPYLTPAPDRVARRHVTHRVPAPAPGPAPATR